jgi:hypothetical protein
MKLPADPRRACRVTPADYGPAVVLLAVAQWGLWSGPGELRGSRVLLASGMVLAAVALVGRRRWPVPALLLTGAGVLVPAALGSYAQSGAVVLMLVVAVFACGRYARPPVGYLGLPLGVALALAGSALDPHETLGSSWKWSLNALWIFALGVWMRQAHDLVVRTQQEQQAVARMAAAEERLRVAQDLHDVLAHSLSVMVVQAEVADELLESDPAAARAAIDRHASPMVSSATPGSKNHRGARPNRCVWSIVWGAPLSRSSGGRSAVHTIIGTQARSASTTAACRCVVAVPLVVSTTAGRPDSRPMPSAQNAAARSSWNTCVRNSRRPCSASASGVDREPGAITAWVTPARTHSSTRVAQNVACVTPGGCTGTLWWQAEAGAE